MRVASPAPSVASASDQVSAAISAAISSSVRPDRVAWPRIMPPAILSMVSAISRMSAAVPMTSPEGSWIIRKAFSGMTISSPAMAT